MLSYRQLITPTVFIVCICTLTLRPPLYNYVLYRNSDDMGLSYLDGCDGFHEKSKKIFDGSIKGSVIHQLCYDDNDFGHRDVIPVDCELGVVVNGYSQGSHVASLAGNYAPTLVTAGLFWGNGELYIFLFPLLCPKSAQRATISNGNGLLLATHHHTGNYNTACAFEWPTCLMCAYTDVPCMNSNSISLPKEKRRNIIGKSFKLESHRNDCIACIAFLDLTSSSTAPINFP